MQFKMASSWYARLRGLLKRKPMWLGRGGVLLLTPCRSVHTFGMRYRIDIAFADEAGSILKSVENVKPGRIIKCPRATMTLERFTPGQGLALASTDDPWLATGEQICLSTAK